MKVICSLLLQEATTRFELDNALKTTEKGGFAHTDRVRANTPQTITLLLFFLLKPTLA